ncbi:protein_of Conserved hypothetical protein function DUF1810 [Hexamita inflata]|uniref:DUF1810 domain-containing protein n=1 Tax=Hexamita inflata TaxID=28002 RepID=A0ABP1GU36_9EUKA
MNEQLKVDKYNLNRFIEEQNQIYKEVLSELKSGQKESHWIWYIFPQLKDLGFSGYAKYFGIQNLEEAQQYLLNEQLNTRFNCRVVILCLLPLVIMGWSDFILPVNILKSNGEVLFRQEKPLLL